MFRFFNLESSTKKEGKNLTVNRKKRTWEKKKRQRGKEEEEEKKRKGKIVKKSRAPTRRKQNITTANTDPLPKMYDDDEGLPTTAIVLTVSIATFLGGFAFGLYAVRGWVLFGPEIAEERRRNLADEVESDESDVELDEADGNTLLDHAPNWSNSAEADRRDGLRQRGANAAKGRNGKKSKTEKLVDVDDAPAPNAAAGNSNEECKLVLVVRTDLGMTKGKHPLICANYKLSDPTPPLLFNIFGTHSLPLEALHSLPLPKARLIR